MEKPDAYAAMLGTAAPAPTDVGLNLDNEDYSTVHTVC
jgi:hypothetical protein